MMNLTIFTITGIRGSQISVHATLNVVCAFAICLDMMSSSSPFGDIHCTNAASGLIRNMKSMVPVILNVLCAMAVLLAFLDCPMDARSAVMVVPMLSPKRIGIAPARPMTLCIPSGPGCDAKF